MAVPTPKDIFASKKSKSLDEELLEKVFDDMLSRDESKSDEVEKPKKFVRQSHLTSRALKNHPGLMALKDQIAPKTK